MSETSRADSEAYSGHYDWSKIDRRDGSYSYTLRCEPTAAGLVAAIQKAIAIHPPVAEWALRLWRWDHDPVFCVDGPGSAAVLTSPRRRTVNPQYPGQVWCQTEIRILPLPPVAEEFA